MTLPDGVQTCTVTIGVPLDALGNPAKTFTGKVRTDRDLIWAATGEVIWRVETPLPEPVDGKITFEVPLVDQAGVLGSDGTPITNWAYRTTTTATWAQDRRSSSKAFQVFADTVAPLNLDLIPDAGTLAPVEPGDPYVTSIAGQSGAVTTEALAEVLDGVTATQIGDPGSEVATALGAQISATTVPDQVDFVELVRANAPRYTSCRLVKTAANTYQIRLHDGGAKGTTYQFIKDTNDDFIKIDGCYTGFGYSVIDLFDPTTADLTGTWNTATASWYTTAAGATFTGTAKGSRIDLRLIKEARGGLWAVTIDSVSHGTVSCWNATTTAATLVTLATGLDPDVEHVVVLTYAGDDPAHVPTGGAGTGRAYVRDDAAGTLVGYTPGAATTNLVLADGSNKEMAFTTHAPTTPTWFPDHGTGSAFKITDPAFYVDGAAVNVTSMAINDTVEIASTFELRQHFHGRVGGVDYVEFHTSHIIGTDGRLSFSGRCTCLAAVTLTGYPLMLPGWHLTTDTFVTGLLNEHVSAADESTTYFAPERDAVFSGAVVSSTNANLIGAGTLSNPRLTYRRAATTGRPPVEESMYVWNRATKPKMYWRSMQAWALAPGDAYAWSFDLMVAEIDNVRAMVTA